MATGEVPWFKSPPDAKLARLGVNEGDVIYGWLHFVDPKGKNAVVPVTLGDHTKFTPEGRPGMNIWHIEIKDGVATVSPSVHYIGEWHTPNPVQFKIVEVIDKLV